MPSRCLLCLEVAISKRTHLWEGKNDSNQPCESSKASPGRCRQESWASMAIWERVGVVTAGTFLEHVCRLSWPTSAKTRSGLVPTLRRWEEKLSNLFGLWSSYRLLAAVQQASLSPWDVALWPQLTCWQVVNIQTGVWPCRDGR